MATFDPRMPEVQAHISVTPGVQDDTASRVLAAGWEVGKAAWQGKAMADLVGAESHEDNVSTADQYGAFEYDSEGNPLSLAIDTDLTKIANARKQGRLTAGRARAQANMRIREAINDNPMFAREIAERGQRFFGNVLGGSGGGSVLEPTNEEKLEEKLHNQMVTDLAKEELTANQLSMDVATYRQYQRAEYLLDFNAKQLEGNQKLNQVEVQRGVSSAQTLAEQDLMTRLTVARQTHGDLLAEPVRQELRSSVLHHRNTMIAAVNRHRADVGGTEATAIEQNLERWADNMIELIDSGNVEAMAEAGLSHTETMAKLQTWQEMPTVVRLFAVSPELGKMHLDILTSSPARLDLLAAVSPAARFLRDHHGAAGFDAAQIMAPYLGEAMIEFATGERTPQPEGMPENPDMEMARDFTAVETIAAGQGNEAMLLHLQEMARDTPESLGALLTRTNRHRMNTDPAYRSQAEQALRIGVEGIERGIASGQYSLDAVRVRETTEHERRQAQDPRADGFGAGRWRGLQDTRIESNPDAVRQFAIDRQRGVRDNMDPNDVARRLQTVMSVAEMYPDMKINGVNAKEYINTLIRGDAPGIPWMREEQIQDMEFNDQRIGGEEGSGVGGLEVEDAVRTGVEPEVLANVPQDSRAQLEGELQTMRVALNEGIAQIEAAPGTRGQARYNQLVGGGPNSSAELTNMTLAEVMDYQRGMIGQGHMSSAVGKYQFLRNTLNNVAQQMGLDPATTKFTPEVQEQMQSYLAQQNATILRRRNLPTSAPNLYLMHNLGPRSATNLLRAEPSATVDTVLSEQEIRNNPGLYGRPPNVKTVEEVMRALERRFEGVPGFDDVERQMASIELIDALSHLGGIGG